jgi:hypothetical protein
MKQTAVEWLVDEFKALGIYSSTLKEKCEQANAKHKEQILDALDVGYQIANEDVKFKHIQTTEQYYNETYGGNK